MKSLISFFLCLSLALSMGGPIQGHHAAAAKRRAGSGGGGGPSFLVNEGFEGAGTAAGWFNSGADFDYTASPLVGAQSLRINADGNFCALIDAFTAPEVYGKFRLRVDTLPSSFAKISGLAHEGSAQYEITLLSDGRLSFWAGGGGAATSGSVSTGVDYWVYFRFQAGAGGAGLAAGGFSATEIRPTSGANFASGSNVLTTGDPDNISFSVSQGTAIVVDAVQIATTSFD